MVHWARTFINNLTFIDGLIYGACGVLCVTVLTIIAYGVIREINELWS